MKTLRILLISFIILSCMDKKEHIIEKTDPSLESQVEKFKGRVLKNGDSVAYDRLRVIYGDWSYDGKYRPDLLPYSLLMAEKYNYQFAYHQVYTDIIELNNKGKYHDSLFSNVPLFQKETALYYLEKGASHDDVTCIESLIEYYHYENELEKANSLETILKELLPKNIYRTREERLKLDK